MRIVSLCPSLTELVFSLGRGGDLVGRTRFCVHPAPDVEAVERVGGTKNPKVPRIVELAPDLVLMNEEENRLEDAAALQAAAVPCHVSFPRDAGGAAAMVRSIGAALGRAQEAERIALDIEVRSAAVRARALGSARVRFAYLIWRRPWMVAAGDTFVSALLCQAGGENVFAHHADRYPAVTEADLAAAAPDALLLSSEPFPFRADHAAELAAATGIPPSRFHLVDGEALTWHGARTPSGVDYAERVIGSVRAHAGPESPGH